MSNKDVYLAAQMAAAMLRGDQDLVSMTATNAKNFESRSDYALLTDWTKNLLDINVSDVKNISFNNSNGTWSGNTYTNGSLTITVNADGTLTVNGSTGSSYVTFVLRELDKSEIGHGLRLQGCPENSSNKAVLRLTEKRSPYRILLSDVGDGGMMDDATLDVCNDELHLYVKLFENTTFSNFVIKPMIFRGDAPQPYVPHEYEILVNGDSIRLTPDTPPPVMITTPYAQTAIVSDGNIEVLLPANDRAGSILRAINNAKNPLDNAVVVTAAEFANLDTNAYPTGQVFMIRGEDE